MRKSKTSFKYRNKQEKSANFIIARMLSSFLTCLRSGDSQVKQLGLLDLQVHCPKRPGKVPQVDCPLSPLCPPSGVLSYHLADLYLRLWSSCLLCGGLGGVFE
ncbi:hypothetical protein RRG08_020176 [Elysia crispata]|uniref:Uncharacterized protein n=1 Tax=Elysia crispata TaxID=231223 RepID=A0AAE0YNW9_9GAST|nr:hypothetical protein RRG08_020176 [Elysia crispata]